MAGAINDGVKFYKWMTEDEAYEIAEEAAANNPYLYMEPLKPEKKEEPETKEAG